MSLLSALRSFTAAKGKAAPETCFPCVHFRDDPAWIEAELPGLAVFSSGHASVRAEDGLCQLHGLMINGRLRCPGFQRAR